MKTPSSIPDDVLEEAKRLTEVMNQILDEVRTDVDEFSQRASRRVLEKVEW